MNVIIDVAAGNCTAALSGINRNRIKLGLAYFGPANREIQTYETVPDLICRLTSAYCWTICGCHN